ncbi:SMI1/KNR4 family protein [Marivirga sp. S37H4]|uniref:SMI1/KNR4 family protein n=1 Tax=Marivirga aurantiaca TaxID=2802615 RepID=A0A934WXT5_9BACT|nr:SMI1/KNR4 family protein [Marivirga aurantiaca]MBK6264770.1 SMI1/KNR4 family protein [Marivirga aurantiaca]
MNNIFGNFELVPNEQKGYVDELEKEFNVSLPPIFKTFCQTFVLNSLTPNENHHVIHPNEDLGYEGFRKSLVDRLKVYSNTGDYYQNDRMLPIITSGIHNGGICVSLDNDEIYVLNEMTDERFVKISKNIFEFISQLQQISFLN